MKLQEQHIYGSARLGVLKQDLDMIGAVDPLDVGEYRFGFEEQETDAELLDVAVTYTYRIEDPRIGNFFSIDPLFRDYPWNSNYAFSENRVIDCIELEGLEAFKISDATATIFDETSGQPKEIPRKVLTLTDPGARRLTIPDENGNLINNFKYCYFISMIQGLSEESSFSENTLSPSYVTRVPQLEEFKTFTSNTFELTTDSDDQPAEGNSNAVYTIQYGTNSCD